MAFVSYGYLILFDDENDEEEVRKPSYFFLSVALVRPT